MQQQQQKVAGWDVTLLKKRYFVSTTRLNVAATIISLPYIYNIYNVVQTAREKKKETGKMKIAPSEVMRIFGADFAFATLGLVTYFVLKQRAGLTIATRYIPK